MVKPHVTDRIHLKLIESELEVLLKIELIGIPPEKTYNSNPVLEPLTISNVGKVSCK